MTRHRPHDRHGTKSNNTARPSADARSGTGAPPDLGAPPDASPPPDADTPPATDAPPQAPGVTVAAIDPALVYDAMEELEAIRHGLTELIALGSAAGHFARKGTPLDTAAGRRTARQLAYLALLVAQRGEALEDEVDRKVRALLDRFDAASQG